MRQFPIIILVCAVVAVLPALFFGLVTWLYYPDGHVAGQPTFLWTADPYVVAATAWAFFALPMMALMALVEIIARQK